MKCYSFQSLKNIKTVLSSWVVQKQTVGWVGPRAWVHGPSSPCAGSWGQVFMLIRAFPGSLLALALRSAPTDADRVKYSMVGSPGVPDEPRILLLFGE